MHDKKLFGTSTVGTKGQIVIPADAREQLGIDHGDRKDEFTSRRIQSNKKL
jgi:bifunctional DNA-binding transcriptional regulator/antitoxin component of YhaV-PrlF toxin-antitoxin module